MPGPVVVVPCFNEELRIRQEVFEPFIRERADVELLFVDDGSTDGTWARLNEIAKALGPRASMLQAPTNRGKAEAVRLGLLTAIVRGAPSVGFYDADGATPATEMMALHDLLRPGEVDVAMGSRVALLGRNIRRRAFRHYTGRVFATMASLLLDLPVYDTQCGAKFFVSSPLLREVLQSPFRSRWAFDVELIGRLRLGTPTAAGLSARHFVEMPLKSWEDVAGSKVRLSAYPQVLGELVTIARDTAARRRQQKGSGS